MSVCVDASLVVKWLLQEEGSDEAIALYRKWAKAGEDLIAPSLIDYEVGTALRQKVVRGALRSEDLYPILDLYHRINLLLYHLTGLVDKAVHAAASLDQPTVYDVAYLLTAKQQEAEYVTADEKFFRKASPVFSFVRYYRDL